MAGEITNQEIIGNWLDECMYQLAGKAVIGETSNNNITLDRVAISLKFEYGPSIVLGGIDSWASSPTTSMSDTSWTGFDSQIQKLFNVVLKDHNSSTLNSDLVVLQSGEPTVGSHIKFVQNVVAPLNVGSPEFTHITSGSEDQCTYWADTTNNLGEGWGVTFGTQTATGTKITHEGTHGYSLFINNPGIASPEGYPADTKLYKISSGTGINAVYSEQSPSTDAWPDNPLTNTNNGWGTRPDIVADADAQTAYNHGELTQIDLYVTIKGNVGSFWTDDTWYKFITHGVDDNDHVDSDSNQVDAGVNKVGWVGALDKTDDFTAIDVNDGVQDVRIRFSHGKNSYTQLSSNAWNPKDFLNWAVHRSSTDFANYTNEYLLPSRVSILSSSLRWINNSKLFEVGSAVYADQWEHSSDTGNTIQSWSDIKRTTADSPLRYLKAGDIDQGVIREIYIEGNKIVVETNMLRHNKEQVPDAEQDFPPDADGDTTRHFLLNGDALVVDATANITQIANPTVDVPSQEIIKNISNEQPITWQDHSWTVTTPPQIFSFTTDGSGLTFQSLGVSGGSPKSLQEYWTGIDGNDGSDLINSIFTNCLTLVLFDPKLWWSNAPHAVELLENTDPWSGVYSEDSGDTSTWTNRINHGAWTDNTFIYSQADTSPGWWTAAQNGKGFKKYSAGRNFQRYTDPVYANVKILAFQPDPNFSRNDKLRITIPLGKTQN